MTIKKFGSILFGLATVVVLIYSIYKVVQGEQIGFNEIFTFSGLLMMFLSSLTWGEKEDDDGILLEEELGQKILEKSSKIGYLLLTVIIIAVIGVERAITGENSIYLVVVLGFAMITKPLVEFFVSRKYN